MHTSVRRVLEGGVHTETQMEINFGYVIWVLLLWPHASWMQLNRRLGVSVQKKNAKSVETKGSRQLRHVHIRTCFSMTEHVRRRTSETAAKTSFSKKLMHHRLVLAITKDNVDTPPTLFLKCIICPLRLILAPSGKSHELRLWQLVFSNR